MAEIDDKREEIREGLAKLIMGRRSVLMSCVPVAEAIMKYLHDNDVVIKMDRESPENPYPEDIFSQDDILKGRVSFVEPLIGDKSADILV